MQRRAGKAGQRARTGGRRGNARQSAQALAKSTPAQQTPRKQHALENASYAVANRPLPSSWWPMRSAATATAAAPACVAARCPFLSPSSACPPASPSRPSQSRCAPCRAACAPQRAQQRRSAASRPHHPHPAHTVSAPADTHIAHAQRPRTRCSAIAARARFSAASRSASNAFLSSSVSSSSLSPPSITSSSSISSAASGGRSSSLGCALALAAGAAAAAGAAGVAAGRGAPKPLRCTRQHTPGAMGT